MTPKNNFLMRLISLVTTGLALFSVLIISSCSDDETISPATVTFTNSSQTLGEAAAPLTITINFDKEAPKNGTITLQLTEGTNTDYTTHYTTNPIGSTGSIDIDVSKGQTAAQFTLTPVNNSLLDGNKSIEFLIAEVSSGLLIGSQKTITITIIDDEGPSQVNFAVNSSSTTEENATGIDVVINLSAAAPGTGSVTVSFTSPTAVYTTNFTTNPAASGTNVTVPIAQSATSVNFKVIPVDDANVNAARTITFTLASTSGVVELGTTITSHTVTITDNETPSTATFTNTTSSVSEGEATGITVPITLNPQTVGTGTIKVTLSSTNATYNTHFITDPAATNNELTVNVGTGVTSANFKVIPVDDTDITANRVITFTLTSSTGIVILGVNNLTHEVIIVEDDIITSIADVRALYTGSNLDITSSLRIQGVVTSINDNINTNNIWVQDATAGIVVRFSSANNNTIARGDEIVVQLSGGQLTEFNGLRQVQSVLNANAQKIDNGILPTPEVISITQLNTGNYEGKLVRINDVHFPDADGVITMSGNKTISDGTTSTTVRTESGASFSGQMVPIGIGTVTGLAGDFNSAQLIPQVFTDDIFTNNPVGSIGVTQNISDFGSINNGALSTSQMYSVQGTTLAGNLSILPSSNFEVSKDNASFSSSVSFTSGEVNGNPQNVYVRFAPNTGVDQTLNGTITHKSPGVAPVTFSVSGTESGNGGTTLLLNEHFDYATGQLTAVNGGANVSGGNWINFSGTANVVNVVSGSLTYTNYIPEVGNKVTMINGSAEDAYTPFTAVTTGKVYVSFLVKILSATGMTANISTTGDYFAGLMPSTSTTALDTRVSVRTGTVADTYNFGLRATSSNAATTFNSTDYDIGVTHLIVISYEIVSGTTNDVMRMWIDPDPTGSEPSEDLMQVGAAGDLADVARFFLRQGTNAVNADVDGIRVAQNWNDLFN